MWKQIAVLTCLTWACGLCLAKPGVWHGVDDRTGNTIFYLYLAGPDSRLFSPEWVDIPSLEIEKGHVSFRLPYKTYGMKCVGELSESQIKGTWRIHQVQYVMNGSWTARQVFAAEKWSPSSILGAGSDVDIVSRLSLKFDNFRAFVKYWDQQIEPEFFALLTETIYADAKGDYRPGLKDERLKRIYETVNAAKRLPVVSERMLPAVTEARELLRGEYPWLASDITVVTSFSFGAFDYKLQKIADRYLLLFGVDWIAANLETEEVVRLAAEGLISSFHFRTLPLGSGGRYEVIRRSIAAHTLDRLNNPEFQYRIKGDEVSLAESKRQVKHHLDSGFETFYADLLAGKNRPGSYQVFLEFGRSLAGDAEASKAFRLKIDELKKALAVFFAAGASNKSKEEKPQVVQS